MLVMFTDETMSLALSAVFFSFDKSLVMTHSDNFPKRKCRFFGGGERVGTSCLCVRNKYLVGDLGCLLVVFSLC